MTVIHPPDQPVPAGFNADDWATLNEPRPFRLIWGPQRRIDGNAIVVRLTPDMRGTLWWDHFKRNRNKGRKLNLGWKPPDVSC